MTIESAYLGQLFLLSVLAILGFMIRQVLSRLSHLETGQQLNSGRLIRIETRLGIDQHDAT